LLYLFIYLSEKVKLTYESRATATKKKIKLVWTQVEREYDSTQH